MENTKKKLHYGYVIIIALCLITVSAVTMVCTATGIFYTPLAEEFHISTGAAAIYVSCMFLTSTITLLFAGQIFDRVNAKIIMVVGCTLTGICTLAMSFYTAIWQFYATGCVMGVSVAFTYYVAAPVLVNRWFKAKAGLFIGVTSCFTGVGGAIFNSLGGYIIERYGWRQTYLIFGILTLIISVPSALLIVDRPEKMGLRRFGEEETAGNANTPSVITGVSYKNAIKNPVFYVCGIFTFIVAFIATMQPYLPTICKHMGATTTIAANVSSICLIGSVIAKLSLGRVNDKSVKLGMAVCLTCGIVSTLILALFAKSGWTVVFVCAFIFGFAYAATAVQCPVMVREAFGSKDYAKIWGNVSLFSSGASCVASSIWGFMIEGWGTANGFFFCCAMCVVSLVMGFGVINAGAKIRRE